MLYARLSSIGLNVLRIRTTNYAYLRGYATVGTRLDRATKETDKKNDFLTAPACRVDPEVFKCDNSCDPPKAPEEPPKQNFWKPLLIALGLVGAGALFYLFKQRKSDDKPPPSTPTEVKNRVPSSSADIPKFIPYLLIGGGTASFSAFRAIKSHDPKAKVMVITNEIEMPYMRPPLSKELWFNQAAKPSDRLKFKQWNGVERSLFYEPDEFYVDPVKISNSENGGVTIVRGYHVKKIDVCDRLAILDDGTEINYGECLIATGSNPRNLDVFIKAEPQIKNKISFYKTKQDYENLRETVEQVKSIAIVGGGFLGSELACALAKYSEGKESDLKIYQIFYETGNMGKILPEYLSRWTTDRVKEEGVITMPQSQIQSVDLVNGKVQLNLKDCKSILVDHVIVAIGSKPNTELAETSDLETDRLLGGFVVNAELEARRHLFVAGDVACFYDPKLGRRRVEHHDHAVVSGRLAGENMVGLKKPYTHQSMFWSDLGPRVGYEAIGVIDSALPTVAVFAKRSDKDVPESSGLDKLEGSEGVAEITQPKTVSSPGQQNTEQIANDDYGKGVIFYLRKDKIVGIVLWNVFNRIGTARKIIAENKKYDDLNEVAKLFDIHEQQS